MNSCVVNMYIALRSIYIFGFVLCHPGFNSNSSSLSMQLSSNVRLAAVMLILVAQIDSRAVCSAIIAVFSIKIYEHLQTFHETASHKDSHNGMIEHVQNNMRLCVCTNASSAAKDSNQIDFFIVRRVVESLRNIMVSHDSK